MSMDAELRALVEAMSEALRAAAVVGRRLHLEDPAEDSAFVQQQVAAALGWSAAVVDAFLDCYGEALPVEGVRPTDAARRHGVSRTELVRLLALKAEREAALGGRLAAFVRAVSALVPEGKTVGEALSTAHLDALARDHGLTIGPDGQPALAADAAR